MLQKLQRTKHDRFLAIEIACFTQPLQVLPEKHKKPSNLVSVLHNTVAALQPEFATERAEG
ncbi:MAG: hypothetical protein LH702_06120 [Phormidesmis sp. CAN_BIN44]|nr:hypothetical protein [Phormidesmis sp. CAN_BIN44]